MFSFRHKIVLFTHFGLFLTYCQPLPRWTLVPYVTFRGALWGLESCLPAVGASRGPRAAVTASEFELQNCRAEVKSRKVRVRIVFSHVRPTLPCVRSDARFWYQSFSGILLRV